MAEIKLNKRYKYAGDIFQKLIGIGFDIETVTAFLNEVEDADVVEVVRCEKCIHSEDYNGRILCNKNAHIFDKNDFCSYGTPKERGADE